MTWGSERWGIASSGVRLTAYMPAATMKTVAIRISRTFRLDQRMMAASIGLFRRREAAGREAELLQRLAGHLPCPRQEQAGHDQSYQYIRPSRPGAEHTHPGN